MTSPYHNHTDTMTNQFWQTSNTFASVLIDVIGEKSGYKAKIAVVKSKLSVTAIEATKSRM